MRIGNTSKEKKGLTEILNLPEVNERYLNLIKGQADYAGEALYLRANNRTYHSRGVQTKLEDKLFLSNALLSWEYGLRYHEDKEDRFQWDDTYSFVGGRAKLFAAGVHGSNSNQITSAAAVASYLLGKLNYGRWHVMAGVRYEDVMLRKKNYGKNDPRRTGHQRLETSNHVRTIIPSIGASYRWTDALSLFGGVHKGFAPPSAGIDQKAESSINTELGLRWTTQRLKAEMVGYYNHYYNMLGSDLAAAGGLGTLEQFDVGEAKVKGLEAMLLYQLLPSRCKVQIPLQVSYTLTDTHLGQDFKSSSWGQVFVGDEIPYIYRHALTGQIGLEHRWLELHLSMRYNGAMRTTPGQGAIPESERVPSHFVMDASVQVHLKKGLSFKVNAINLLNRRYLVSRHPSGLRPGHPRGVYVGFNYTL